jgi:hypothetical protein
VFDFTIAAYITNVTNVSVVVIAKVSDVQMFTFPSSFMKLQITYPLVALLIRKHRKYLHLSMFAILFLYRSI